MLRLLGNTRVNFKEAILSPISARCCLPFPCLQLLGSDPQRVALSGKVSQVKHSSAVSKETSGSLNHMNHFQFQES